jgi:site-specific DNA-cytosine methylase
VNIVSTLQSGGGDRGYRIDAEAAAGGHLVPAWPVSTAPTLNCAFADKQGLEDQHALNGAGHFVPGDRHTVRRLTPTECERLQGFPDRWTLLPGQAADSEMNPKPDSHRYSMMGNAVTVNVAEWLGGRIVAQVAAETLEAAA